MSEPIKAHAATPATIDESPLAYVAHLFGREATKLSVPGRINGVQVIAVAFQDGSTVSVESASVPGAWSELARIAALTKPEHPSNSLAERLERSRADLSASIRYAEGLEKALEPFADAYQFWSEAEGPRSDDTEIDDQGKITMGDCRRAMEALGGPTLKPGAAS